MSKPALPGTAVVICSRNRPRLLRETVASLLSGGGLPAELLVVDQSDEPSRALAELRPPPGCKLRYLPTGTRGLARARNLGLEAATQRIVAFTDDDMFIDAGWLEALVGALAREGRRAVVTGRVLAAPSQRRGGGYVPALKESPTRAVFEGRIGMDQLAGGNMAAHRDTLLEMGGFDERLGAGARFPAAEDCDLGYRLLEAGYRIVYEPAAVLYHRAWRSTRDYLPMRWAYARGQGAYYAKHLSLKDRYMLERMARQIAHKTWLAACRARRQPRVACGDLIYVFGLLRGSVEWLVTQRTSPSRG